jgi:antitoxin Phd
MNEKLKKTSKRWQLQEAKAKFSQVFEKAIVEGPQYVTRRGKDEAVLLPAKDYEKLLAAKRPRPSLLEVLRSAPTPLSDLDTSREDDPDRRIPNFAE